jgi:GNAT superfamily N-acetyltransferase
MEHPDGPIRIEVPRMIEGHADAIHAIHSACLVRTVAAHYSPEQMVAWMKGRAPEGYIIAANSGERFFVAEADGLVLGFSSWQDDELLALFRHPDVQNRGVGTRLIERCLRDPANQGAVISSLNAAHGAEEFYARHGFVPVARGRFTKHGVVIQDTRMVLSEPTPRLVLP